MAKDPRDSLFSLEGSDPRAELIDRGGFAPGDLEQVDRIMAAMGRLRAVERRIAEASERFMRLGHRDMRALHFMIVCANTGELCTPGMLARHLAISTASTTKLLDRLEAAQHIRRGPHPHDRRAVCVEVLPETRAAARKSVGRHHAARFAPAARLSPAERETVVRFLTETADAMEESLDAATADPAGG